MGRPRKKDSEFHSNDESQELTSKKESSNYFLNNRNARLIRVGAPSRGSLTDGRVNVDKSKAVFLQPGINMVSAAQFEYFFSHPFIKKHGHKLNVTKCENKPDGFDSFSDIKPMQAEAIVSEIVNLDLLKTWKSQEPRPSVLTALNNQIEKVLR